MQTIRKTSLELKKLIVELEALSTKEKAPIWKAVANILNKSSRQRVIVNLEKINKFVKKDEIALVPGKLLSTGSYEGQEIAAYQASAEASKKIKKLLTIQELMKKNPKGKKVRIIC